MLADNWRFTLCSNTRNALHRAVRGRSILLFMCKRIGGVIVNQIHLNSRAHFMCEYEKVMLDYSSSSGS